MPRSWTWLQLRALVFAGIILLLDGFDLLAISHAAPQIRTDLALEPADLGRIFLGALLGMAVGSFVLGPLADRFGPRMITAVAMSIAGLGTLLATGADSSTELLIARLLTGFGLGGAWPGALAMAGDYAHEGRRKSTLAVVSVAFGLGGALAGFISSLLAQGPGWRGVFLLGGSSTLLCGLVLFFFMPEGLSYLYQRRREAVLRKLLERLPRAVALMPVKNLGDAPERSSPITLLFADGWWRLTIGLWTGSFLMLLTYYFVTNWMSTTLVEVRGAEELGRQTLTALQLGVTGGGLAVGFVMDRLASRFIACSAALLTAVAAGLAALVADGGTSLLTCALLIGFFSGRYAGRAELHRHTCLPPTARTTGIAWVLAVGRIGAMISPLLGGYVLAMGAGLPTFFLAAAILPAAAGSILLAAALWAGNGKATAGAPDRNGS